MTKARFRADRRLGFFAIVVGVIAMTALALSLVNGGCFLYVRLITSCRLFRAKKSFAR
jgi:hypothetical protein